MKYIKKYKLFEDYKPNEKQKAAFVKWSNRKNIPEALEYMDRFFKVYPKLKIKDINQYKNLEMLKRAIEEAESFKTAKDIKREAKKNSVKKRIGNKEIILALTPEASSFYGAGTMWCTSMKNEVYHWLLHRIMGVEFYIINHDLPDTDTNHKLSVHINWNKRYSTVYDSDNKPTFDGITHEYTDIKDLEKFIDNEEIFEYMMKEFEITKKDAPKFIGNLLKKFVKNKHLKSIFEKYHVLKYSIENFLEIKDDYLNESEFDVLNDFHNGIGKQWLLEFGAYLKSLNFDDILNLLDLAEEKQLKEIEKGKRNKISLDDHVFIMDLFDIFLFQKDDFKKEFYSVPIIFDMDDEEWLTDILISVTGNIDVDDYIDDPDFLNQIEDCYNNKKLVQTKEKRIDTHKEIISSCV